MQAFHPLMVLSFLCLTWGCVSAPTQDLQAAPTGAYSLDKSHASLTFSVMHGGLSRYTMRFNDFNASLDFDAGSPETSRVTAIINAASIDAVHPTKDESWDKELATDTRFLEAGAFPQIIFKSTQVTLIDKTTARVTGDLTLKGVTLPMSMTVTYNGANIFPWSPGRTSIGFSASGHFNRSDFGMTALAPNAVGDKVEFRIEVEFKETNTS